jgi:hypothetical protein
MDGRPDTSRRPTSPDRDAAGAVSQGVVVVVSTTVTDRKQADETGGGTARPPAGASEQARPCAKRRPWPSSRRLSLHRGVWTSDTVAQRIAELSRVSCCASAAGDDRVARVRSRSARAFVCSRGFRGRTSGGCVRGGRAAHGRERGPWASPVGARATRWTTADALQDAEGSRRRPKGASEWPSTRPPRARCWPWPLQAKGRINAGSLRGRRRVRPRLQRPSEGRNWRKSARRFPRRPPAAGRKPSSTPRAGVAAPRKR